MAPSKLSDTDKQQITELYCQPGETTSTLAKKFGVSSSTVSRVLKQQLSDEDYGQLMQWKRSGERGRLQLSSQATTGASDASPEAAPVSEPDAAPEPGGPTADLETAPEPEPTADLESEPEAPMAAPETALAPEPPTETTDEEEPNTSKPSKAKPVPKRRSRRRSTVQSKDEETAVEDQLPLKLEAPAAEPTPAVDATAATVASDPSDKADPDDLPHEAVAVDWGDDGLDEADDYADDDYVDDEDDEDDLEDEQQDWDEDETAEDRRALSAPRQEQMTVLPFNTLVLKKPCYLVVDRLSELITCPLKDFAELGLIPQEEEQARTLPVFDNHRIARRFSRRNQRIVKVPDGMMLTKTQHYLHAKGITRILFDGQVYALN
ncbi:MAG: helix-turn-helix domain-containing protein [Cyanobacteria bacterium J06626_18]